MNLALSLLAAAERHPEPRRSSTASAAHLRGAARRGRGGSPAGSRTSASGAATASRRRCDNRAETVLLYWAASGSARSSCRSRGALSRRRSVDYCVDGLRRDGARDPADGDVARLLGEPTTPARSTVDESASRRSCSTPRARPAGRRASRARTAPSAPAGCAGRPARLPPRRPHARRDAALPHDGHPLAARDAAGRRLLRAAAATGTPGEALRLIESERITSLYLAPTLFHDLVHHPRRREHDLSSVRDALLRRGADDGGAGRACVEAFRAARLRQPLRLDGDLHLLAAGRPAPRSRAARAARG